MLSLSPSRSRARAVCRIRQDTAEAKLVVILLVKPLHILGNLPPQSESWERGSGGPAVEEREGGDEGIGRGWQEDPWTDHQERAQSQ